MRIRHFFILIAIGLFFPAYSPADKNYNKSLSIQWSSDYRLGYHDFNGKPNITGLAALTSSGIEVRYSISNKELKTTVVARFYPENSWIRNSARNAYVLQHEQLHFDITEWHARTLRKTLSSLHPGNTDENMLKAIIKNNMQQWQDLQSEYDKKTDHGLDKETQKIWEGIVSKGLQETAAFAL